MAFSNVRRCVGGRTEVERLLRNMKQSCGKPLKDFLWEIVRMYVGIVNCSDVSCAENRISSLCHINCCCTSTCDR